MTCDACRSAGDENRRLHDKYDVLGKIQYVQHPKNCECTCAHEMPTQWEDMFRNPPPWQKKLEENPPL